VLHARFAPPARRRPEILARARVQGELALWARRARAGAIEAAPYSEQLVRISSASMKSSVQFLLVRLEDAPGAAAARTWTAPRAKRTSEDKVRVKCMVGSLEQCAPPLPGPFISRPIFIACFGDTYPCERQVITPDAERKASCMRVLVRTYYQLTP
jgi:hypothetical protein